MRYPIHKASRLPRGANIIQFRQQLHFTPLSSAFLTAHYGDIDTPSPPLL
jgi:hypothetical protein